MRLLTWIVTLILLCSCSVTHNVQIKKQPCLYPYIDYNFTLCHAFHYKIDNKVFKVPAGFTTDLASIPKILWSIFSPNKANTIPAAVIHDFLYFCPGKLTRIEADRIFYDALISNNVKVGVAFKYWMAVRLFGEKHFHKGAYCTLSLTKIINSIGASRFLGVA